MQIVMAVPQGIIMTKEIHIVFRVINYLTFIPVVSNPEKLLLILLASFAGVRGICPSVPKIAKRMGTSERQVYRLLKSLEDRNLIKITRTIGRAHVFELMFLSTTPDIDVKGIEMQTPDIDVKGTPDIDVTPPLTTVSPYITNEVTEINNRGGRKKRAALSLIDFCPNEENQYLCKDLGLNLASEVTDFQNRFSTKLKQPNLQYEFGRWLKNSYKYKQTSVTRVRGQDTHVRGQGNITPPKYKDWTAERQAREEAEQRQIVKPEVITMKVDDLPPVRPMTTDHLTWRERKRLMDEGKLQEVLANATYVKSGNNGR